MVKSPKYSTVCVRVFVSMSIKSILYVSIDTIFSIKTPTPFPIWYNLMHFTKL